MSSLISIDEIPGLIFLIRSHRVMLDADLARLYGTTTKRLNEQVKRNRDRFPEDFMFQLGADEKRELVANCDRFNNLKHSNSLPYAFTEHGALMLANILSSSTAVNASIEVVRAFVKLRKMSSEDSEFRKAFEKIEGRLTDHDQRLKIVFDAVRQIMSPSQSPLRRPIGIKTGKV